MKIKPQLREQRSTAAGKLSPSAKSQKAGLDYLLARDTFERRFGLWEGSKSTVKGVANVLTCCTTAGPGLLLTFAAHSAGMLTGATSGLIVGVSLLAGLATVYSLDAVAGKVREKFIGEKDLQMQSARHNYREALLEEMNDEGVREATETAWGLGLKVEQDPATSTKGRGLLTVQLSELESLAEGRLRDDWQGELAQKTDQPSNFVRVRNAIASSDDPSATYREMTK